MIGKRKKKIEDKGHDWSCTNICHFRRVMLYLLSYVWMEYRVGLRQTTYT
jgi:hypothetical protein